MIVKGGIDMKRHLKDYIHLAVVFSILLGIGLSVFLYENKPREPEYIHYRSTEDYIQRGYELKAMRYGFTLAVVDITGTSIDTQGSSTESSLFMHYTHTKARVVEVLHGDLDVGEKIYLRLEGNSRVIYVNPLTYHNLSRIEECGGYPKKGERMLVLLFPYHAHGGVYGGRYTHLRCGLYTNHVCCYALEYSMRTVHPDGSLSFREGSYYENPYEVLIDLPYTQYDTLQELRNAVAGWKQTSSKK